MRLVSGAAASASDVQGRRAWRGGLAHLAAEALDETPLGVRLRNLARAMGGGIGPRLLGLILLFSTLVALLSTLVQLYVDYRRDVGAIENRLDEIGHGYVDTLSAALWHVNIEMLNTQMDGIMRLPDMRGLEVAENPEGIAKPLVLTAGKPIAAGALTRDFSLTYEDRGQKRIVGRLRAEATLDAVYQRLTDKAVVILATQSIKTFLVSLFTLYIVHRLVTRHLAAISQFLDQFDLRRAPKPLALIRTRPDKPDELDRMVASFNGMSETLRANYDALLEAHATMARDYAARRRAEEEVIRLNTRLEQQVRQRTAELETANAELRAFSYSVSHDLRAPLRRIEGFGRMLADDLGDRLDERGAHYLNRIRNGAHDMSEMIDSYLVLSRAAQGELSLQPVDLAALAQEIVDALREKDPERAVEVIIGEGMTVEGDRRLLGQALGNLIENAWKYTRKTDEPQIEIGVGDRQGRRAFFVRDNGAGFDMEEAKELFTPFRRLHRAEDFEGTGIGLATVRNILARHGGRIRADAAPGRGATFHFTLWEAEAGA
jgi:signal transduction histidine kinase